MSNSNFEWNETKTCEFTGEELCEDKLERTKYANYLTNYLNSFKNESYVFNLNSEWGSGKTYFIKRWANSIADKHPVVYIDAWKSDNHSDPLLLVLSAVINRLQGLLAGLSDEKIDKQARRQNLINKSTAVIKASAPLIVKGLVKKVSGIDIDEITDANNEESTNKESSDDKPTETGKSIADAMSKATQELLKTNDDRQQAIEGLRLEIENLLDEVICKQADGDFIDKWSPMYIFIDELDRCRPTFAIELLEVVKHIFDIKKVIFVIATDTEQLQHSIKAVYGEGFDSARYLMRFFQRSFSLAEPSLKKYITTHQAYKYIKQRLSENPYIKRQECRIDDNSEELFIIKIFELFGCELRTVNQILERTKSILVMDENKNKDEKEYGAMLIIILECIKTMLPSAYEKLVSSKNTALKDLNLLNKHSIGTNLQSNFPNCQLTTDTNKTYTFEQMFKDTISVLGKGFKLTLESHNKSKLYTYIRYSDSDLISLEFKILTSSDIEKFRQIIDRTNQRATERFKKYKNYIELAANLE